MRTLSGASDAIVSLRGRLQGPVLFPGDAAYAAEVQGFNTADVPAPDVVVRAASDTDIAEAVRFARSHGLKVSVQGAGHGGYAPIRAGLLVSTRALDRVEVDAAARVATLGAGARWGQVIAAAAEHGLSPVAGSSPDVGAVGYLVGGGLGPLSRSHGNGSDYVVSFTVVTGTGERVEANDREHRDLFWALRGGKSGLGIVTELRLRLVELRTLYGGTLFFDEPHLEQALRGWVAWTASADSRVTTSVAIVRFPAVDALPPPFRGRRLLGLRFAFPGASEEGEELARPLRAVAPIYLDALGELPAAEIERIHNDPRDAGPVWIGGALLRAIDQDFATTLLAHAGAGTNPPFLAVEVRHLGAANQRELNGPSAVGGRSALFALGMVGRDPSQFAAVLPAASRALLRDLGARVSSENHIHFMGQPTSEQELASAWPRDTYERLGEVRRRYDPDAVFAHGYSP